MLNDGENRTFKMFATQISNYLFVISFQLMFYKTSRYRLVRASLKRVVIVSSALCHENDSPDAS